MARYVVEARDSEGNLKFDCPQPPVRDWTEDDLASAAWNGVQCPGGPRLPGNEDATLDGTRLLFWLSDNVCEHWQTRVKYW